jgi:NAD(P)-dependent dehydrogenase (short-subunit alcohol dehydrogenase family)
MTSTFKYSDYFIIRADANETISIGHVMRRLAFTEISPEFIQKLANKVPLNRIGQAKELQGVIVFLASTASSYVNGVNLQVDGGWTCW